MNGTAPKLTRSAAVALIAGASLVAIVAIILVTITLKPLASEAITQQSTYDPDRDPLPALESDAESHSGDPESLGELPDGVTPFDEQHSGITNLDPELLSALRAASTAANAEGVDVFVNSGWRSAEHQAQMYREAVATYGSAAEASRWVATPETSAHVSGAAVDIGDAAATEWFAQFGAGYGLCQTYANESWHYELRPEAITQGCPAMSDDASIN